MAAAKARPQGEDADEGLTLGPPANGNRPESAGERFDRLWARLTPEQKDETLTFMERMAGIPHPDAEVLALAVDLERSWEEQKRLERDAPDDTPQEAFDVLHEATKAIVRRIIITPASTLDGLKVKALAIRWCYCDDLGGVADSISGDTTDRKIAASIILDLLK